MTNQIQEEFDSWDSTKSAQQSGRMEDVLVGGVHQCWWSNNELSLIMI